MNVFSRVFRFASLPWFVFDHLVHTEHDMQLDARMAGPSDSPSLPAKLPLVMFSHGLGGVPDVYQVLLQDLASHGFLVAAVEHNDGSAAVTLLPETAARWCVFIAG